MILRHVKAVALPVSAAALIAGCVSTTTQPNPRSACGVTREQVQGDSGHTLRLLCPNGGTTYRVGDTITIVADCDGARGSVDAEFLYSVDDGITWEHVPNNGIYWSDAVSLMLPVTDGRYPRMIIPDSVVSGNRFDESLQEYVPVKVSSISDKWRIKVWDYVVHDDISDQTDLNFSVVGR